MSEEMSEERYDTDYILDNLFRASRRLKLNAGEFEVLCALVRHDCPDPRNGGKRKEEVWPSPRQGLHDITGRPRRTVQRVLDRLEKKGAITCLTPDNRG
jgi:DNA-binding MarR family transcriptional regulator